MGPSSLVSLYILTVALLCTYYAFKASKRNSWKRQRDKIHRILHVHFTVVINSILPCSVTLARENSRFSSLFAAGDVSREGTCATQRQKFHTDDVNQCLQNTSGSHGVPHRNLFNFTFLPVDFTKVLCSSANELQQNSNASSREEYILQILTVLL